MKTTETSRWYLKSGSDVAAFLLLVFGGPLDLWYETSVVAAHYRMHYGYELRWFHIAVTGFIFVQLYWNLYFVTMADNRSVALDCYYLPEQKTDMLLSKKMCVKCCIPEKSHSYHCKICDSCILRRDHHCWFVGNCVGQANQRYFLTLVLYLWLKALMENIYNLQFVTDVLGVSASALLTVIVPHFPILIKEYSLYCLFVNAMTFTGVVLLVILTLLLWAQLAQLFTGLTRYERSQSSRADAELSPAAVYRNIHSILGKRWYLVWLAPIIPSLPPEKGE